MTDDEPMPDRRKSGWTWGKDIVATIVALSPFVLAGGTFLAHLAATNAQNTADIVYLKQIDDFQDRQRRDRDAERDARLQRIEQKLDRIAERQR